MSTLNTQGPDIAGVISLNKQQVLLGVYNEDHAINLEDQEEEEIIQIEVPPVSPMPVVEQEAVAEVVVVEEATIPTKETEDEDKNEETVSQDEGAEINDEVTEINDEGAEPKAGTEDEEGRSKEEEDPGEADVVPKNKEQTEVIIIYEGNVQQLFCR